MNPPDSHNTSSRIAALQERISDSPHLIAEYMRLARLLEESGDPRGAAAVLQKAHFFLPNGPAILEQLKRLSKFVDSRPAPVTIIRPQDTPPAEIESKTDVVETDLAEVPPPGDDLDQLIEELESGRMDPGRNVVQNQEVEWVDDDGLVTTETLAHIYVSQKQFKEAILVYHRLAEKESDPEKAAAFRERAAELRGKLGESS